MDTSSLNKAHDQIIAKIEALDLAPIKFKLMDAEEGEGWSRDYADRIELEYKRFLMLLVKHPDASIAPTKAVDKFWHGHILDTLKYAEDCHNVFGYFLHHFPYFGMRGSEDAANLAAAADNMHRLYQEEFGDTKPAQAGSYCGATTAESYCGVAAAGAASYCGVAAGAPSYCGAVAGKEASTASRESSYCGAATTASYCGVAAGKPAQPAAEKPAYCGVAAGAPSYCGAVAGKEASTASKDSSYCGVVAGKASQPSAEQASYCGVAAGASSYCGIATFGPLHGTARESVLNTSLRPTLPTSAK